MTCETLPKRSEIAILCGLTHDLRYVKVVGGRGEVLRQQLGGRAPRAHHARQGKSGDAELLQGGQRDHAPVLLRHALRAAAGGGQEREVRDL